MKKVFVAAALVLGTLSFSACDSKPAAETEAPATDSAAAPVESAPVDTTTVPADTMHADSASH